MNVDQAIEWIVDHYGNDPGVEEALGVLAAAPDKLKMIFSHWNEFGPEHGFGELMDMLQD